MVKKPKVEDFELVKTPVSSLRKGNIIYLGGDLYVVKYAGYTWLHKHPYICAETTGWLSDTTSVTIYEHREPFVRRLVWNPIIRITEE